MKEQKLPVKLLAFFIVLITSLVMFFPFYWMLITGIKPLDEIFAWPPKLWPSKIVLSNFAKSMQVADFPTYFKNSFIVTFFSTVITVGINLLAGYAFAKYEFKGKRICFAIVLSTLMIPLQVTMIPNFIIATRLHIRNTYLGMILPPCAEAFGLFLSKQFIEEIPNELLEAGRLDGATEFQLFHQIVLPNVKSLTSVLVIFTVMWRWNDFQWPLIMVSDSKLYTVQLGLSFLNGAQYINWNHLMCGSLISIVPVVVIFLVFQKEFVQGMASSGIKG